MQFTHCFIVSVWCLRLCALSLFYSNPQVFNDITSGNNPGCGTNGFTATQGWDPVTGLGTPNFEAMASLVKSLP